MKKYNVIDLFCGCGGLSFGFSQANYQIIVGIDIDKDSLNTFSKNHKNSKAILGDLVNINPKDISEIIDNKKIDIIIGGPPCQGFSIAGKRIIEDDRNKLYKSFLNFVNYYQPKAFLMENVPNILSIGAGKVKENIISDFNSIGYNIFCQTITASDFGVPQKRKRAFFIGLKNNQNFIFPISNNQHIVTTEDAISDLSEMSINDGSNYTSEALSSYQKLMRLNSFGIYNHIITNHKEQTINIISQVPDGGNYKDLPVNLQQIRKVNIAWTRLNSKKPSLTIDTGHRHHFHYKFNRIPTVRESARIQSFPDNFIFSGSKTSQYKQVGNAVPPILVKVLAEKIREYL